MDDRASSSIPRPVPSKCPLDSFVLSIESYRQARPRCTPPRGHTLQWSFTFENQTERTLSGAFSQLHCLYGRANNGTTHFLCEYILTIADRSRTCRQANTYDDARGFPLERSILCSSILRSSYPGSRCRAVFQSKACPIVFHLTVKNSRP